MSIFCRKTRQKCVSETAGVHQEGKRCGEYRQKSRFPGWRVLCVAIVSRSGFGAIACCVFMVLPPGCDAPARRGDDPSGARLIDNGT